MSSQDGEDALIAEYFGNRIGQFLDIGANLQFSNTVQLAEAGWSGVCVEPGPGAAKELREHYAERAAVRILEAAITERSGSVELFESTSGGAYSTTEMDHRRLIEIKSHGEVKFTPMMVRGMTCRELLAENPGPYNFVNIDVEGRNASVLGWLLDETTDPEMICVEISMPDSLLQMQAWLVDCGFKNLAIVGGNLLASK